MQPRKRSTSFHCLVIEDGEANGFRKTKRILFTNRFRKLSFSNAVATFIIVMNFNKFLSIH